MILIDIDHGQWDCLSIEQGEDYVYLFLISNAEYINDFCRVYHVKSEGNERAYSAVDNVLGVPVYSGTDSCKMLNALLTSYGIELEVTDEQVSQFTEQLEGLPLSTQQKLSLTTD